MEFRKLGHSDISVSALSLGSWLTFEYIDEQEALAVIVRGIAEGINFLDDARYDDRTGKAPLATGYSEVVFGGLLRKGGWKRAELVIANKLWHEFYPKQTLAEELDGSLSRLQTDYLDIVYSAELPESLPLIEMLQQVDRLIASGKLRSWGVLNWPAVKIEEACRVAKAHGLRPPCAAQLPYSILQRAPVEDLEIVRVCDACGVGVVASYSLHGGLLSGKYNRVEASAANRLEKAQLEELHRKGMLQKAEQVTAVAREIGCTPAQLAFAYCLRNKRISSVLFGAKTVKQINENLGTLQIVPAVDEQVMARLRAIAT
jgi:aryl-alcohol dehydrogenase-like predicted oxidoreductase